MEASSKKYNTRPGRRVDYKASNDIVLPSILVRFGAHVQFIAVLYVSVCVCVCVYNIYIILERERERERQKGGKGGEGDELSA